MIRADDRVKLWRLARLGHDEVRGRPVLLYPEGAVLLNDTGRAILERLDGTRTVGEIAAELAAAFEADVDEVTADVRHYLGTLAARELVHVA